MGKIFIDTPYDDDVTIKGHVGRELSYLGIPAEGIETIIANCIENPAHHQQRADLIFEFPKEIGGSRMVKAGWAIAVTETVKWIEQQPESHSTRPLLYILKPEGTQPR